MWNEKLGWVDDKYFDICYERNKTDEEMVKALKKYILEGKKMPIKTGIEYELKGFTFVPVTNKFNVKKIIHSGPCTIVFWEDNTKTVVRLEEGKEYDEYAAFTAALAKKVYGNNSKVHKILETKTKLDLKEMIKRAKTVDLFPDIPEEKKKASREAAIKRRETGDYTC